MSHRGRLLVATPLIADPTFERTVVLLLAHSADGAFGVILNRPSDTTVLEAVPAWAGAAEAPAVMYVGGPVARDVVVGLACHQPAGTPGFEPLADGWGTVDLNDPPELGAARSGVRLFVGSAGWTGGQLEDELAEGAWWPVDSRPDDLITAHPSGLWSRVLRRQPGEVAWFANHPRDPSAN